MKRAIALVVFVICLTAGVWWYVPPTAEHVVVMYRHPAVPAQTGSPPPAPSSINSSQDTTRLSLEYIAKRNYYMIYTQLNGIRSYTEVSVLHEKLGMVALEPDGTIKASLVDDLGQQYNLLEVISYEPLPDQTPKGRIWRAVLRFPPLNPQAANVIVYVKIGEQAFELSGASLP